MFSIMSVSAEELAPKHNRGDLQEVCGVITYLTDFLPNGLVVLCQHVTHLLGAQLKEGTPESTKANGL